jgi:hypothetical protein
MKVLRSFMKVLRIVLPAFVSQPAILILRSLKARDSVVQGNTGRSLQPGV